MTSSGVDMNRAERRKAEKKGQVVPKEAVINIKSSDVHQMKVEAAKNAAETAFLLMLSIPMSVLHDKHGWGKVRCERFTDQVLELYDSFNKDYVTLDDLEKCLWDEAGIKIERSSKNGK